MTLSKQRIVVPLSALHAQLPTIVPWLDRLVPGVWLSPPPPKIAGGSNDIASETRARREYAPRQGFVPWHARDLMRGWGVDCGGVADGIRTWRTLDTYEGLYLVEVARMGLEQTMLREWLRSPSGEPRLSYQTHALGYALAGVLAMALHWGPGCLSGNTDIVVNRAGGARHMSLRDLYEKQNGTTWDPAIPTRLQSMDAEGFIRLNDCVRVVASGRKPVFELRTEENQVIRATADHRFWTPGGWRTLAELRVDDEVAVSFRPPATTRSIKKAQYPQMRGMLHHPHAVRKDYEKKQKWTLSDGSTKTYTYEKTRYSVPTHRLVAEADANDLPFDDFIERVRAGNTAGLTFFDPKTTHVHHKDRDWSNYDISNLEVLPVREHLRLHGIEGGWKHCAYRTRFVRIVAIERQADEETFDIEMAAPMNNFVANDFVVHNSGKTRAALEWALAHAVYRRLRGDTFTPIVITTPSNVVRHWERQVRKWTTLDPVCWTAPSTRRKRDHAAIETIKLASVLRSTEQFAPLIVIVSHDNLVDAWDDLGQLAPGVAVFDEAHLFRQTKRMTAAPTESGGVEFSERTTASGDRTQSNVLRDLATWAAHGRLETTATPIGNRFAQLWVQLDLLMPGEFGSFYTWSARYAHGRPGEYGGWDTFDIANAEEHRAHTKYFFYEVPVSESNALLPAKRRETIYLPISEQVAELGGWQKIIAKSRQEGRARELEAKLMQAASRKRKYVTTRALETIAAGQKVVILTGRRKDVESIFGTLTSKLLPAKVPRDDATWDEAHGVGNAAANGLWWASGEVDQDTRAERCDEYMKWKADEHDGRGACLVGTLDCLGIGIDLQDTDLGLIAMLPWTWDVLWQAEGRFQRQGMTRPVLIEFVIAEGTYDEHVAQTFLSKLPAIGAATPDEEVAKVGESLRGLSNMPALLSAIFDKIAGGVGDSEVERIAED